MPTAIAALYASCAAGWTPRRLSFTLAPTSFDHGAYPAPAPKTLDSRTLRLRTFPDFPGLSRLGLAPGTGLRGTVLGIQRKTLTSPLPTLAMTGTGPSRSITLVGSNPQLPLSITAST